MATYWLKKSRNFYTPPVFGASAGGDSVGISWRCLMLVKLEWLGYRTVKKNYDDMLSRFHLIPERHGQTDRRIDRPTDKIAISISPVSVVTRDKNDTRVQLFLSLHLYLLYLLLNSCYTRSDVTLCSWNSLPPLAGNTWLYLSTSVSAKQSGWPQNLWTDAGTCV